MHAAKLLVGLPVLALCIAAGDVRAQEKSAAKPPRANAPYDAQLGGVYPPADGVEIVSRDRNDPPADGVYSICYLNAFQTQAEDSGWWKKNHPDLLLRSGTGYFEDPNWPDEILLDTSTEEKRAGILSVIGRWIDECAENGFRAIEPDNLDTWTRSDGKLNAASNILMAAMIVERAHAKGLAAAQKNASELGPVGKSVIGFDFAIAESCQVYDECDNYIAVYGDHVFEIEYPDEKRDHFADACAARGDRISIVLRDHDLSAPDDPNYRYQTC
jgi:hypothetical protein